MERQALRDAVVRYNAEGAAGLFDRPKGHRPEWLTESEQATLLATVFKGPKREVDGVCTWTGEALAIWISEKFGNALVIPDNITLVLLPPYSPECNPVERIWLYLRERFLSLQVFPDHDAIVQACCDAWNALYG